MDVLSRWRQHGCHADCFRANMAPVSSEPPTWRGMERWINWRPTATRTTERDLLRSRFDVKLSPAHQSTNDRQVKRSTHQTPKDWCPDIGRPTTPADVVYWLLFAGFRSNRQCQSDVLWGGSEAPNTFCMHHRPLFFLAAEQGQWGTVAKASFSSADLDANFARPQL